MKIKQGMWIIIEEQPPNWSSYFSGNSLIRDLKTLCPNVTYPLIGYVKQAVFHNPGFRYGYSAELIVNNVSFGIWINEDDSVKEIPPIENLGSLAVGTWLASPEWQTGNKEDHICYHIEDKGQHFVVLRCLDSQMVIDRGEPKGRKIIALTDKQAINMLGVTPLKNGDEVKIVRTPNIYSYQKEGKSIGKTFIVNCAEPKFLDDFNIGEMKTSTVDSNNTYYTNYKRLDLQLIKKKSKTENPLSLAQAEMIYAPGKLVFARLAGDREDAPYYLAKVEHPLRIIEYASNEQEILDANNRVIKNITRGISALIVGNSEVTRLFDMLGGKFTAWINKTEMGVGCKTFTWEEAEIIRNMMVKKAFSLYFNELPADRQIDGNILVSYIAHLIKFVKPTIFK